MGNEVPLMKYGDNVKNTYTDMYIRVLFSSLKTFSSGTFVIRRVALCFSKEVEEQPEELLSFLTLCARSSHTKPKGMETNCFLVFSQLPLVRFPASVYPTLKKFQEKRPKSTSMCSETPNLYFIGVLHTLRLHFSGLVGCLYYSTMF